MTTQVKPDYEAIKRISAIDIDSKAIAHNGLALFGRQIDQRMVADCQQELLEHLNCIIDNASCIRNKISNFNASQELVA